MTMLKTALIAMLFTSGTLVWAIEDDSYTSYDAIVGDLKASADTPTLKAPVREELNWDEVAIQGGLGLTASMITFAGPDNIRGSGLLKGFEAHAGFNLFSKVARGEAAFRNFGSESVSGSTNAVMREIEARIVFLPVVNDQTVLRMGAGLAGRFLSLHAPQGALSENTPFYSLLLGFERKFAKNLAVGPELSHHAALDASSFDKSSWDASLRLNATF